MLLEGIARGVEGLDEDANVLGLITLSEDFAKRLILVAQCAGPLVAAFLLLLYLHGGALAALESDEEC